MTTARCHRQGCNRPLTAPASIERKFSARCWNLEQAGRKHEALENALRIATAPFSARQIDDANALIAAGKVKPLVRRPGSWRVTSRDGNRAYFCSALSCPCRSPGPCCHMCAVVMLEIAGAYQEVA